MGVVIDVKDSIPECSDGSERRRRNPSDQTTNHPGGKAVYDQRGLFSCHSVLYMGFRRSPRLWGDHRDSVMKTIKIQFVSSGQTVELVLEPLESEPNLWKVVKAEGEKQRELEEEFQLYGMVMTYVDDIFISGCQPVCGGAPERVSKHLGHFEARVGFVITGALPGHGSDQGGGP